LEVFNSAVLYNLYIDCCRHPWSVTSDVMWNISKEPRGTKSGIVFEEFFLLSRKNCWNSCLSNRSVYRFTE